MDIIANNVPSEVTTLVDWILKAGVAGTLGLFFLLWNRGTVRHEREVADANARADKAERETERTRIEKDAEIKMWRDLALRTVLVADKQSNTMLAATQIAANQQKPSGSDGS